MNTRGCGREGTPSFGGGKGVGRENQASNEGAYKRLSIQIRMNRTVCSGEVVYICLCICFIYIYINFTHIYIYIYLNL